LITIQNADAALKDYYLDAFSAQLNEDVSPFFNAIEKTAENVYGKDVKMTIVRNHMGNVIAGDEDGDLPAPYANRYYTITMPLKNIYGTIEISDKALKASKDSSGAVVNLLNAEMEGLVKSAKANFSRMLFGDGKGYISTVTSRAASNTFVVSDPKSYSNGMLVDIIVKGEVVVSGATILSVDLESGNVIFDTDISKVTIAQPITINVSGAYNKELFGLAGIFNNANIYGYSKQENSYFRPTSYDASVSELTESFLVDCIDGVESAYEGKINMIICSYKNRKRIAQNLMETRRIVNTTELNAGYTSLFVNDVPVYADKYCPDDKIYLLNTDDFSLNQLCDWEWMEDEDGKILKQVPGKAAYSATIVKYAELICKKPCGQGIIYVEE
jgi:uncharacterized protein YktA (UPF0223 family)